ncbi:MAG: PEP-CTERM sorting domain-containing protein [Armatimonadota bacterium]
MRVFVIAALIILLTSVAAQADQHVAGTAIWNGSLWDYTYHIEEWIPNNHVWALVCPDNPGLLEANSWSGPAGEWSGQWYANIPAVGLGNPQGVLGSVNDLEVVGQPGIVWTLSGITFNDNANANYFHFQSAAAPTFQHYDGDTSWEARTIVAPSKLESETPEPCSLVLMSLVMAGGSFWRRRRTQNAAARL